MGAFAIVLRGVKPSLKIAGVILFAAKGLGKDAFTSLTCLETVHANRAAQKLAFSLIPTKTQ